MSFAKRPKSLPLASAACALPFAFHWAPRGSTFYVTIEGHHFKSCACLQNLDRDVDVTAFGLVI